MGFERIKIPRTTARGNVKWTKVVEDAILASHDNEGIKVPLMGVSLGSARTLLSKYARRIAPMWVLRSQINKDDKTSLSVWVERREKFHI